MKSGEPCMMFMLNIFWNSPMFLQVFLDYLTIIL